MQTQLVIQGAEVLKLCDLGEGTVLIHALIALILHPTPELLCLVCPRGSQPLRHRYT